MQIQERRKALVTGIYKSGPLKDSANYAIDDDPGYDGEIKRSLTMKNNPGIARRGFLKRDRKNGS
jgi:hypothetical protein